MLTDSIDDITVTGEVVGVGDHWLGSNLAMRTHMRERERAGKAHRRSLATILLLCLISSTIV
jgi:hypothetical protein